MANNFINDCDGIIIRLFNNLVDNLVKEIYSSNIINKDDPNVELKRLILLNNIEIKENYLYNWGKSFGLSKEFLTHECLIRLAIEYNKTFVDKSINKIIKTNRKPENIIEYFCTKYKNVSMNNIQILEK